MGAHKPLESRPTGSSLGEVDSYFEYNRAMISRNREVVFLEVCALSGSVMYVFPVRALPVRMYSWVK